MIAGCNLLKLAAKMTGVSFCRSSQLFSGTLFPFFGGGGPTKNGLPQEGFPFFCRVTEQLRVVGSLKIQATSDDLMAGGRILKT